MKKVTISFKDLFDLYSSGFENNIIHSTNKKIFTKSPTGELVEIKGLIRKTNNDMVKVVLDNNITHKASSRHLLKTENSNFKQIKDMEIGVDDILIYRNRSSKIKKIIPYESDGLAYDISLDFPHEYITPNNLIHHNTTTAKIIVDSIIKNQMDIFELNGSAQTGVDTVRNDITEFLKSPPYASKIKIVFIDEFDYMSGNAQAALRHIFEKYAATGRFICTANYESKIIDPILSRFVDYRLERIKEEFAIDFCIKILEKESVTFEIDTVKLIVQNFMPDIRKAINTLQRNVTDGKLQKIDREAIITNEKKICGLLSQICDDIGTDRRNSTINQNMPIIMELVYTEPDYRSVYQALFNHDKIPLWAKIKINDYSNRHQGCAIPSSHFLAMIYDTIECGIKYHKLMK